MKKSIKGILSALYLFMLLFNPGLALEGARQGIMLWGNVVLPTLLPFIIYSGVIVAMDAIHILTGPFRPILSDIPKLSGQGSYVLMNGPLCGYSMGAKTTSDFLDSGRITPEGGEYLLAIGSHPSPTFALGYMIVQIRMIPGISQDCPLWVVAAALYLPVIPISILARNCYHYEREDYPASNKKDPGEYPFSFDKHMMGRFETMTKIGGYIILFSILTPYLTVSPFQTPPLVRSALLGAVEITTGIQAIVQSAPGMTGVLLIIGSAAFGGCSGIFQTKSVSKNIGLSIRHYMLWKLMHNGLSCVLFYVLIIR